MIIYSKIYCNTLIVTLYFKDKIECINLIYAPGTIAHTSRQITRSIIAVYLASRLIKHIVLTSQAKVK
jgi:uncharacterized protein YigE (DUF2233 family)